MRSDASGSLQRNQGANLVTTALAGRWTRSTVQPRPGQTERRIWRGLKGRTEKTSRQVTTTPKDDISKALSQQYIRQQSDGEFKRKRQPASKPPRQVSESTSDRDCIFSRAPETANIGQRPVLLSLSHELTIFLVVAPVA